MELPHDRMVFAERYAFCPNLPEIGKGGQAKVYKGVDLATNTDIAIKKIPILSKSIQNIEREISNISKLSSPFIVKFLGDIYRMDVGQESFAILVMEYVAGGTLNTYLKMKGTVEEETAFRWMQQLIFGLSAAWDMDIVHRDIKPGNILLTKPSPEGEIRICDFGISKNTTVDPARTRIGTPRYMAPEIDSSGFHYDLRVDIYSLGLVYLDMLLGMPAGKESNLPERLKLLQRSSFSDFAKKVIPKMVERDPNMRLKPQSLLPLFRFSIMNNNIPVRSTPICSTYQAWDCFTSSLALLKNYNESYDQSFEIEASIVSDQAETGIISFIHCFTSSCFYERALVLEYCQGDTLQRFIEKNGPVNELIAKRWLSSLLQTLQLLHSKGFVLRNLSPSNIVLDQNSVAAGLKYCDFELAAMKTVKDGPYELGVDLAFSKDNLAYRAPELLRNSLPTTASDVWSLGCVFSFVLEGKTPFTDSSLPTNIGTVMQAQRRPLVTTLMSDECSNLLEHMLNLDEISRYDTQTCLEHTFFTINPLQKLLEFPARPKQRAVYQSLITSIRTDLECNSLIQAYIKSTIAQQLFTQFSSRHVGRSNAEVLARVQKQVESLVEIVKTAVQREKKGDWTEETVRMAFRWYAEMEAAERAEDPGYA